MFKESPFCRVEELVHQDQVLLHRPEQADEIGRCLGSRISYCSYLAGTLAADRVVALEIPEACPDKLSPEPGRGELFPQLPCYPLEINPLDHAVHIQREEDLQDPELSLLVHAV